MADVLSIDYESWNECDLRRFGSYRYITHPSFFLLMMAWAFNEEEPVIWLPGMPLPQRIIDHVKAGGLISGWNSMSFERLVWREQCFKKLGWPEVADHQWFDPMLLAVAANLPRSLDGAAKFVGASAQKDKAGHALMAHGVPVGDDAGRRPGHQ